MIRFSIKGLLIAVAVVAVGLVALLNASYVWSSVFFLTTLLLLLTAVFALVFGHGESRSFWAGVVVFGWVYFILTHTQLLSSSHNPPLPTRFALDTLHRSVSREVELNEETIRQLPVSENERRRLVFRLSETINRPIFVTVPNAGHFHQIGQCLFAWLFALIGGFVARCFYLAKEREKS